MTPNELIERHIGIAGKVASKRTAGRRHLYDEVHSVCLEALTLWANEFDAAKSHGGYEGFGPSAVQRCNWAATNYFRREGRREMASIDATAEGDDRPLSAHLPDPAQHRAEDVASAREIIEAKPRRTVRCADLAVPSRGDMRAWVDDLRASCFDAVTPGDMKAIMEKVVERAKLGDLAATKLLLDYLCGGKG